MKSGTFPVYPDHRDYSFHGTFGAVNLFPNEFDVDAGLTMPNQEEVNNQFNPAVPALPYGCTDYTQSELCNDEDKQLYNPMDLENVTHASADRGCSLRISLGAAVGVYKRSAYFNVEKWQTMDWFDCIRSAIYVGDRSVSVGSPWFPEWTNAPGWPVTQVGSTGILPQIQSPLSDATQHNWKISGWKVINGVIYLKCKSWQGPTVGDRGWLYMSREILNQLMTYDGTAAFTLAPIQNAQVVTVELGWLQTILSHIRIFLMNLGSI